MIKKSGIEVDLLDILYAWMKFSISPTLSLEEGEKYRVILKTDGIVKPETLLLGKQPSKLLVIRVLLLTQVFIISLCH